MTDDPIVDALRSRPSDEPLYEKPLRRLPGQEPGEAEFVSPLVPSLGVGSGHPTIRTRTPIRALPALALIVLVGVAILALGVSSGRQPATSPSTGVPTYQLTGRVACFGQGPGWVPTPGGPLNDCPNMAVPPEGYGAATWTLDTTVPFSADARDIHVFVDEIACHGFEAAAGRIVQNVQYASDRVVITLAVRSPTGPQTCPAPSPTYFVVELDQALGDRTVFDGGPYPAVAIITAGRPIVSPTPSPRPAAWHQATDCSQDEMVASFYKGAAMVTSFDVYCPVLPAGWSMVSSNNAELSGAEHADVVTISYQGPAGQTLTLMEGTFCETAGAMCMRQGLGIGKQMFGGRVATLLGGNGEWHLFTAVEGAAMWEATGKGMSVDDFASLTGNLIVVGK